MTSLQSLFSNYGTLAAGFFAVIGTITGMVSAYYSHQAAQDSNEKLQRSVRIIERLETVIGDHWEPLDTNQVEMLRRAIEKIPFKEDVQIMYLNTLGKTFAQSLATAFRAAGWKVKFSTGGGFEDGIEVGRGQRSAELLKALSSVVNQKLLVQLGADEQDSRPFVIGVGSKPVN